MNVDCFKDLTENIKWHLDNDKNLPFYKLTKKFAITMLSGVDMEYDEIYDAVSIEQTEKLVKDFFGSLDEGILINYLNIRDYDFSNVNFVSLRNLKEMSEYGNNETLRLYEEGLIDKELKDRILYDNFIFQDYSSNDSQLDGDGKLTIYLAGTIEDVFVIVHEFVHKIFFQNLKNEMLPSNYNFLVEATSILIELLLGDYLIEKNINVRDVKQYKKNRFISTQTAAYNFMFEMMLIEIVEKHGEITSELLDLYISKCDQDIKDVFMFVKNEYISQAVNKGLLYYRSNRYILALVFSCYFKSLIHQDKNNLNILYKIGKGIFEDDYEVFLDELGVKYFDMLDSGQLTLNEEVFRKIVNSYLEEVSLLENKGLII